MTIGISRGELITASSAPDFAVTDDLTVADATSIGGSLAVGGDTELSGELLVVGNLTAGDDFIAKGTAANALIETKATEDKMGFFRALPVVQPTALTAQLTSITHTAPGTPDYALQNLVANTGFGFVTADEGNTVLSVIKNLQTRVAELETKLVALGLVTTA